jgi:ferric-dicitrate binding protein FerR (iron transport regulator)
MTHGNSIPEKLKIAIINYLCRKWDECDADLLTAWLEESDENRQLFSRLINLWEADQIVRREKDFNPDRAWARLESGMSEKRSDVGRFSRLKQISRIAAVLILTLLAGGAGHYLLQKLTRSSFTSSGIVEYTAPYGSKTNLKLPDGSFVWLNAGTTLKYDQEFGNKNRDISLSGEAYFEVVKNRRLPFMVKAKEISVKALGTKFNVKAYPDEKTIETILLEGSVEVQNHTPGEKRSMILEPHQKALFHDDRNDFTVLAIRNTDEVSWFTGKWVIRNTRLENLAKLLERRYNIDFKFDDERIKNYEFGCTIKDETIEQVLTAITYSAPLKYRIINNQVTLLIDESKMNKYKTLLK